MLVYKMDVLSELRDRGYTAYRIRKEKLIGESQMQKIRSGEIASKEVLSRLCELLECQPGDLLEYRPDKAE